MRLRDYLLGLITAETRQPPPAPAPRRPMATLFDAPVCVDCVFYDPEGPFDFLPLCRAIEFAREPVGGSKSNGTELDCHTARFTTICGPEAVLFVPRGQA